MKWVSLLRDIKEKVGFSQSPASSPTAGAAAAGEDDRSPRDGLSPSVASENREKYELQLDFKRNWELFRSSSLEKEKEDALNVAVDIFCRLVKWKPDVSQLINMLSEPHIFSFVIARTFVADIEKLKSLSMSKCLHVSSILGFFTNSSKEDINPGLNLLYVIQALVSGCLDKQPLLDSGILCCLIHVLDALLSPDNGNDHTQVAVSEASISQEKPQNNSVTHDHQLEVEGIIVHAMKVLASQPSAALSLVEDNSLQLLFQIVANGSLTVFSRFRLGFTSFRAIQLHRHAMQILHLLLANDNGSAAKYIHKHHLIKILLMAVKDFNPETGDSASTMGIIDILIECVELSYRPEAGGIKLREDIHNAHGYQFLVQFALILSSSQKVHLVDSKSASMNSSSSGSHASDMTVAQTFSDSPLQSQISHSLSWLLDLMVNLAQTGPDEITSVGDMAPRSSNSMIPGHQRQLSSERIKDRRERGSNQVKDLEAVQMLQDIFLKAEDVDLQAEVLNRMLKIFSSHVDNYKICQQLRVIPLFVLNMAEFPARLQEKILKILEYAVTVVNYIPEQELLSICCLLQQPIRTELKHSFLSFFVKLLSFDQQYKKVLREVGLLEILLDDIMQHKYLCGVEHQNANFSVEQDVPFSRSFSIWKGDSDAILSSPRIGGPGSGKFRVFEDEGTITIAWDCLISLLKKSEANQSTFRMSNGVTLILPFLTFETQRSGVLRLLSCLIMEDVQQAHAEELGSLIEILKSGIITSISGFQYKLNDDAKCDILAVIWRVLGVNQSAQRVFGEATGFSLLLTMFPSLQSGAECDDGQSPLTIHMKLFCFLLRVITAGVCNNAINRISLHAIISSQTFSDLLNESGLICVDYEREVIQLLLELALEIVLPPSFVISMQQEGSVPISKIIEVGETGYLISSSSGNDRPDKDRVYNAGAVVVLIRSLLLFTPKVQLELLNFIEKLAHGGSFNQESLTSIGCVELILETIHPFLSGASPLLLHALRVVQVLGAYRLSSAELQILLRYILQFKLINSGHILIGVMKKLVNMEEVTSENVSLSPFLEMDMSKMGHASIQVSLGERTWPPALGYSFICWFWFSKFMSNTEKQGWQSNTSTKMATSGGKNIGKQALRIFSVGNVEDATNTFYTQFYLQDDGSFTLSMGNSFSVSFPSVELQENKWHHLAVVYSKPNALAGLFQAGVSYLYLNGKLRHAKKLVYSASPVGKALQVTIGTPISHAKVTELYWRMRCCYLYEEVITSGGVFFMYLLGRKYQGLFQDKNLLQFVPNEACGGDNMAILDSLDSELSVTSNIQRPDGDSKHERLGAHGSGMVWDLESLDDLSLELSGKKLIFALDGTSESFRTSGMLAMLNLVDPTSAAASPIGGIPRFGRLNGDIFIGSPCVIGDSIQAVGGMTIILSVVEAAETRDMLHMALSLLASALHKNPKNVHDMRTCRGYHLLALFLYRRMALLDVQLLNILFQIAACEASFCETWKLQQNAGMSSIGQASVVTYDHGTMLRSPDEFSAVGFQGDLEGFMEDKDLVGSISEVESAGVKQQNLNCIVLSNVDMVEHVLLDWTLWATASIHIQIALLRFLEHLVLMNWYRIHNLTILRQINLVKHLLITMQREDIEVTILEKLVVLLRSILDDGCIVSELELVVRFVIMSFGPPELAEDHQVSQEPMGKHIIVRNMLLEMLIDLQVALKSEEVLEQWHRIVSSKLISFFLDEAIHPTSMRWVMILLGVSLSSPSFSLKFHISGGFQGLTCILPSFYDTPEIYYILFCLVFGKSVYPRLPEVRMLDFHALIPSGLSQNELKFVDLLESVIAMAKTTFDRLSLETTLACEAGVHSPVSASLTAELVEETIHIGEELQGEALMHKTYAARLMGGTAEAPAAAASILRFMVDLAKVCHQFSAICQRADFLKCCVDLYFSCVRAACAVKTAKSMNLQTPEDRNLNDVDGTHSLQPASSCLSNELELPSRTTASIGNFPQVQISSSSEDLSGNPNVTSEDCRDQRATSQLNSGQAHLVHTDEHVSDKGPKVTVDSQERGIQQNEEMHSPLQQTDSSSYLSSLVLDSPALSRKSNFKVGRAKMTPTTIVALASWLGSGHSFSKAQIASNPSTRSSLSWHEMESSHDLRSTFQGSLVANMPFTINSQLLLEMENAGSGGSCAASAIAVLDFIAEVFADMVTGQSKAAQVIEGVLETIPLYIDMESALVFQGLCLSRLMNFMERRLLCDDEGTERGFDKNCWSINLDTISGMIVDRVYMGAFPRPSGVLKTLEFLLSMLQFSNKNGCIQEAIYTGKGQLPLTRGSEQLELYIYSLLKNTNRMIMYCFLPSFLSAIGENDLLSRIGFHIEQRKSVLTNMTENNTSEIDICTILQLLIAHQRLVICPANLDTDVTSCLTINLICLLQDQRQTVQKMAEDLLKYLLVHRRAALEELLVSKTNHGQYLDVLHGGFDRLLTGSSLAFYDWLQISEQIVNKVLKQCAAIMWAQFIAGAAKFPGVRIKGIEMRRKREMVWKLQEVSKCELKHFEKLNEKRNELELVREGMSTELRVLQLDKYGSILHAESEWQGQLEQLVHERGIFSIQSFINETQWQLCPIEGPYRMRKKLERCKLRIGSIENILNRLRDLKGDDNDVNHPVDSGTDLGSKFPLLSGCSKKKYFDGIEYHDSFFKEIEESNEDPFLAHIGWDDDHPSSKTEPSVSSALELEVKTSTFSIQSAENPKVRSDLSSPEKSASMSVDKSKDVANKSKKELYDIGEYLFRPFLEPFENIRFCYNCERVIGLDKHDGIFLVGDLCLYVIENFYIDDAGCIREKESEDKLSVIDQALGVTRDTTGSSDMETSFPVCWDMRVKTLVGGRAWAYAGGASEKEKIYNSMDLPHPWRMWKLDDVHDILKRDYQLRPVAIEIFSIDGCNDLLVFHKKEREEVFKNLIAMDLPKNSMLSTTISGSLQQDNIEQSRLFRIMAQSFSKRWQNGEISNFQYLMHLNTLAGRGYNDLTQYPVFPWVLADYESDNLDLSDPKIYRKLDKPMGCQTAEGDEEFRKRYDNWDDPDVPKFHYGSHYSSAAIVLFYLLRLPPFSIENQKLQGGQFDRADRLFSSIKDTWLSASTKGNTSDVKELIPEFFYMPEFLENRFSLNLGEKQSGEKVGDVLLPPWAKGSPREFIRKHREALESDYVSENLHHWIDLIFGYKQKGEAAEEAVNVFYHYTYEGSVDIDAVSDPAIKSSILAQINHFGQTPRQLFFKPHGKRHCYWKLPVRMLRHCNRLIPHEVHKAASPITQIVTFYEKILVVGINNLLEPFSYSTYIAWGYPDRSLRFISYDQGRLLSNHENLHGGNQLQCAGVSHDGHVLVTGGDDGVVSVWQIIKDRNHGQRQLQFKKSLCAHTAKITCLFVSQPYTLIVSGSEDCSVILWDLSGLLFVKQLPEFLAPVSAVYVNDLTGEIVTAAGILLAVWSVNGDCLAVVNTSQLPSDLIMSLTGSIFSDWLEANWFISGHQSGAIKVWCMVYFSDEMKASNEASGKSISSNMILEGGLGLGVKAAEYRLVLYKVLKAHKHPVLALHLTSDLKQLLSGDSGGNLLSWTLPDESVRRSSNQHHEG